MFGNFLLNVLPKVSLILQKNEMFCGQILRSGTDPDTTYPQNWYPGTRTLHNYWWWLYPGVLLDWQVARDDHGGHQGAGGADQAGAGRGEGQGLQCWWEYLSVFWIWFPGCSEFGLGFWIRIRIQGLNKRFNILNRHKLLLFLKHYTLV